MNSPYRQPVIIETPQRKSTPGIMCFLGLHRWEVIDCGYYWTDIECKDCLKRDRRHYWR